MNIPLSVAIADESHLESMAELLGILFNRECEFTPNLELQRRGLKLILDSPQMGTLLVLRAGDQVIGMVSLLYTISTALGAKVANLEDMIVHPDHRGGGAGRKLLEALIQHAQEVGCHRITLLTDQTNVGAQRFYERTGFHLSAMVPMRLLLNSD